MTHTNTLTTPPLAPLLDALFREADAASPDNSVAWSRFDRDELQRLMHSKTEYLDFYGALKHLPLPVSRQTGQLLYQLARASRASAVVEFGTSLGVSTLHLAAALRDNGGGRLITTEFEASKVARAQHNLHAAALADLVEIRVGDALHTLARDLPDNIDLVLLDGAKALYPDILALLESRLRPGALLIADDAEYCPDYLAHVRAPANGYLSLAVVDGVELSMRLG